MKPRSANSRIKGDRDSDLLYLPGSDQWEWWEPVAPDRWSRIDSPENVALSESDLEQGESQDRSRRRSTRDDRPAIYCFGVGDIYALPMWVQSDDPEVIRGMIRVQCENHGISTDAGPGCHIDFHTVRQQGDRRQILALVLADTGGSPDETATRFRGFQVTPMLYDFPDDSVITWEEAGRWVVAFTVGSKVAYFQQITAERSTMTSEVRAIAEMLATGGFIDQITALEIRQREGVTNEIRFDTGESLGHLPGRIRKVSDPVLDQSRTLSTLLPREIAERQQAQRKMRSKSLWLGAVATIYVLAMAAWAATIFHAESNNRTAQGWLLQNDGEVSEIREAQQRWDTLGATIEVDRFPIEVFQQVVSTLPDEGVRLTHFEMKGTTVTLRGEASSTGEAIAWKSRMKESNELSHYDWNFPSPEILPDNRARFVTRGIRNDILAPEGEGENEFNDLP